MSFLHEILEQQRDVEPGADVFRGVIGKTMTFATASERVPVTVPAASDALAWGPCRWTPRVEPFVLNVAEPGETARGVELTRVVYPQKGDDCLVAFDETGEPWVVSYGG